MGETDEVPAEPLGMRFIQEEEAAARLIGLVVIRWGHVEVLSHQLAWHLWDWEDQTGRIITAGMNVVRVWDLINEGLARQEHRARLLPRFKTIRDQADQLRIERNNAVHSQWMMAADWELGPRDRLSHQARKHGTTRTPFRDWRKDLEEAARFTRNVGEALSTFSETVVNADAAWQAALDEEQQDRSATAWSRD